MSSLHGLLFLFDVPLGELIVGSIFLIFTGIYYLKHPQNYYEQRLYVWNFKKQGRKPSKMFLLSISIFGFIILFIDLALIFYYWDVFSNNSLLNPSYLASSLYSPPDSQQAVNCAWTLFATFIIGSFIIVVLSYFKIGSVETKNSYL
jgi:hypothetical protein